MSTTVQITVLVPDASGTTTITTTITATPTATTTTKPPGDSIPPGGYIGIGIVAGLALGALALFIKTKIKERKEKKEKKDRETVEEGIPLYELTTAFDPQATMDWEWARSRRAGDTPRPLPVIVEPAKEADIPALSLQARSVGLSPPPPSPTRPPLPLPCWPLTTNRYPKGIDCPRAPPPPCPTSLPPVFSSPPVALVLPLPLLRLAPWPPKLRPLLTPPINLAVLSGALGAGSRANSGGSEPLWYQGVPLGVSPVLLLSENLSEVR